MVPLFASRQSASWKGVVCGEGTALQGEKTEQGGQEGEQRGRALHSGGAPLFPRGGALIFPGQTEKEKTASHLQCRAAPGERERIGFQGGAALQLGVQRLPFLEHCLKREQKGEDGEQQKKDGTLYVPPPLQKEGTLCFDPYRPLSVPSYAAEGVKCVWKRPGKQNRISGCEDGEGLLFLLRYDKIL